MELAAPHGCGCQMSGGAAATLNRCGWLCSWWKIGLGSDNNRTFRILLLNRKSVDIGINPELKAIFPSTFFFFFFKVFQDASLVIVPRMRRKQQLLSTSLLRLSWKQPLVLTTSNLSLEHRFD